MLVLPKVILSLLGVALKLVVFPAIQPFVDYAARWSADWGQVFFPSVAFDGWASTIVLGFVFWYVTERRPAAAMERGSFQMITRELVNNLRFVKQRNYGYISDHYYRQVGSEVLRALPPTARDSLGMIYQWFVVNRESGMKDPAYEAITPDAREKLPKAFQHFVDGATQLDSDQVEELKAVWMDVLVH